VHRVIPTCGLWSGVGRVYMVIPRVLRTAKHIISPTAQ